MLSPAVPMAQMTLNTGTRAPSSKYVSSTTPSTGAVSSKLVLSVSISAITSPALTVSPLCLRHAAIRQSSTVLPSLGTSTVVAI